MKNKIKIENLLILIFTIIFIIISVIGYIFKIEILMPFIIKENSYSIIFIPEILALVITSIIYFIYKIVKKSKEK